MAEKQILENEDSVNLASGETYILFNNLKGRIVVWINCDKDMAISLTTQDLIQVAPSIFPQLKVQELLYYLNRGDYVFTNRYIIRPLKSQQIKDSSPLFGLQGALKSLKNSQKETTPFGFSF